MSLYIKISEYFTIKKVTTGFFIAFLSAAAMYLDWLGLVSYFINSIFALSFLYFILLADKKTWVWSGFFIGILWFWWMSMSFIHYEMVWAIPIVLLVIGGIYMLLFFLFISLFEWLGSTIKLHKKQHSNTLPSKFDLGLKAFMLLTFSYIHPFGFDWFKPELIFTNTYMGIEKWQFALVLFALSMSIYKKQLLFLLLILGAYPYASHFQKVEEINSKITLHNTHTTVEDKWDQALKQGHIDNIFRAIQKAIREKQEVIVFPESVFALFLNDYPNLIADLKYYANDITIVLGALYSEKGIPHNSAYIFKKNNLTIANKVKLVPFGEQNPLPTWMGDWVNKLFFDGAPDYVASAKITDYSLNKTTYRNAICFEATSEELYVDNPKNMIVLTNNGWLTPSIEPTQQKILLQYYSKKYGTNIYHSVNMSDSYTIHKGQVIKNKKSMHE